jgi:hypothetical protein
MKYGVNGASANGFGYCGIIFGPIFHCYREGYRFAKLACDLVEKHGFTTIQPKVNLSMGMVAAQ